jgi:hypothetical protein
MNATEGESVEQRVSWKSDIARGGVQAILWAFGVATVVSAALAAIVLVIASF